MVPVVVLVCHLWEELVHIVLEVPFVEFKVLLVRRRHSGDGDHAGREVQEIVDHGVADTSFGGKRLISYAKNNKLDHQKLEKCWILAEI